MAKLRVGIVGAGRGKSFARVCRELPDEAEVMAVCDIAPALADKAAGELGVRSYYSFADLLEARPDVAVIASPLPLHAEQAIQALDAGVNVLSEVTACHDMPSAERLAEAGRRNNAIYMLAENYCYLDEVELVRRLVQDGRFGGIRYGEGEYLHEGHDLFRDEAGELTWRGRGWPGCYCSHSLGPLLYILDDRVLSVTAMDCGRPVAVDPEFSPNHSVTFLARTDGGRLLRVRVECTLPRPHNMAYYGLQGAAGAYEAARGLGDQAKVWLADEHEPSHTLTIPGRAPASWHPLADYAEHYIPDRLAAAAGAGAGGHGHSEYWLLKDYFAAVREQRQPPIDVFRGLDYTVPGICAVLSAEAGGIPLTVPDFRRQPG